MLFDEWQKGFENRIRSGDMLPHMEAHLSKCKKLQPALCLILEYMEQTIQEKHPDAFSVDSLEASIRWLGIICGEELSHRQID